MKLIQVRIPSRLLREYILEDAILVKLQGVLLESIEPTWSLSKRSLLLIDKEGRIKAFPFERQWRTVETQVAKRERVRFHINMPDVVLRGKK